MVDAPLTSFNYIAAKALFEGMKECVNYKLELQTLDATPSTSSIKSTTIIEAPISSSLNVTFDNPIDTVAPSSPDAGLLKYDSSIY